METQSQEKPRLLLKRKVYKGILMFENEVEEIEKMETKEDDIWVCSFPRSGTTLTQELVYLIQTLDFDTANSVNIEARFPIIDLKDERYPYYKGLKQFEGMKSPRFIKSHLHECMLPQPLKYGKGRIIYITRNPKDVVASFYRLLLWGNMLTEGDKSFSEFVDAFIEGKGVYCPWQKHVLGYWNLRNEPNVLFLKYEDVVKDLPATVRMIADFLKRTLTDDDVARICEHCHVDRMRKNDNVNLSYFRDITDVNDSCGGGFINKGKPGVWVEVLTPDMSSRIDKMLRDFDGTGLSFDHC